MLGSQAPDLGINMPDAALSFSNYQKYQSDIKQELKSCLETMGCQPILFVGSGLSKRYFGGPNWDELLSYLASACPLIEKDYAYYKQKSHSLPQIGELFSEKYQEWAWSNGRNSFPSDLFGEGVPASAYIKHFIANFLIEKTPKLIQEITDQSLLLELELMQKIRPHALITTNYDRFLELLFPDFTPIIGQDIIRSMNFSFGEIFKMHGCVSAPQSMVFTSADYTDFTQRKKYLSAKLLTFFSEHPLIFLGYSAEDPNIKAILSDIDEAIPTDDGIIPNIFMVEWQPHIKPNDSPARDRVISIDGGKGVRVRSISSSDFAWIYEALNSSDNHPKINAKVLRTLMVRSYELVRHDIPREILSANFEFLESQVSSSDNFAKLFGITTISDPSALSAKYPFNQTQLGKEIFNEVLEDRFYPSKVRKLINKLKADAGFDLCSSDNEYHRSEKYGKSLIHKYSHAACILLKAVKDGTPYSIV
ncbi:MAG: SIR2 family protein [Proteobacteria bacterium]|nr:MAG: SIR2 family protein [Pseudomonadota bacterium]